MEYGFYDFVSKAFDYIKDNGYVKNVTAENIINNYDNLSETDLFNVDKFISWVEDKYKNTKSDYFFNVYSLRMSKEIKERDLNTICSAINLYFKDLKSQMERDNNPSVFVGSINDRITVKCVEVKLLFSNYYGSYYNGSDYNTYRIVGEDKNIYLYGTSKELEAGDVIKDAIIKGHKDFRGEKQTLIRRGKIIDNHTEEEVLNDINDSGILKGIYF